MWSRRLCERQVREGVPSPELGGSALDPQLTQRERLDRAQHPEADLAAGFAHQEALVDQVQEAIEDVRTVLDGADLLEVEPAVEDRDLAQQPLPLRREQG